MWCCLEVCGGGGISLHRCNLIQSETGQCDGEQTDARVEIHDRAHGDAATDRRDQCGQHEAVSLEERTGMSAEPAFSGSSIPSQRRDAISDSWPPRHDLELGFLMRRVSHA